MSHADSIIELADRLSSITDLNLFTKQVQKEIKHDYHLVEDLRIYLDDLYHNVGDSGFSDQQYDIIYREIVKANPDQSLVIGATMREGTNRVQLPFWLGSTNKITPNDPEALAKWISEYKDDTFTVSDKLDGVSCLYLYEYGKVSLFTRGNGMVGGDVSYLQQYIKRLPNADKFPYDRIAVRGELIISKKTFERKFKNKTVNGRKYKNARNMVAGLVNSKTARSGLKDIEFVVYELVDEQPVSILQQYELLKALNFKVVKHAIVDNVSMQNLEKTYLEFKQASEYEIDGLIVHTNREYIRNTDGNPPYMFAFKMVFQDAIHETTVQYIEWNISKWGQLKPVVVVDPVELDDVTMSRATAHNAKYVVDNNLGPGAKIRVTRSKEVIPYIVEVTQPAAEPQMPNVDYHWDKNHVNILISEDNSTQCIKRLSSILSTVGVKHVSEKTVEKMYHAGINTLIKIIKVSEDELLTIDGIEKRSAQRIVENIHKGFTNIPIPKLLGATGVFGYGIGSRRLAKLLQDHPTLIETYRNYSKQELYNLVSQVDGFSDITTKQIVDNIDLADQLLQEVGPLITLKAPTIAASNSMADFKVVFTGIRDKELKEQIENNGGKVSSSVSKKTTHVIAKAGTSSSTVKFAQTHDIPIYTIEQFKSEFITN